MEKPALPQSPAGSKSERRAQSTTMGNGLTSFARNTIANVSECPEILDSRRRAPERPRRDQKSAPQNKKYLDNITGQGRSLRKSGRSEKTEKKAESPVKRPVVAAPAERVVAETLGVHRSPRSMRSAKGPTLRSESGIGAGGGVAVLGFCPRF